jgi:hypothetical protein
MPNTFKAWNQLERQWRKLRRCRIADPSKLYLPDARVALADCCAIDLKDKKSKREQKIEATNIDLILSPIENEQNARDPAPA